MPGSVKFNILFGVIFKHDCHLMRIRIRSVLLLWFWVRSPGSVRVGPGSGKKIGGMRNTALNLDLEYMYIIYRYYCILIST